MVKHIKEKADAELLRGEIHFKVKAFESLEVGDPLIEADDQYKKGYGRGVLFKIFSTGGFLVKFDSRELPVMFSTNGIRWDKEGGRGAKRIKTLSEISANTLLS